MRAAAFHAAILATLVSGACRGSPDDSGKQPTRKDRPAGLRAPSCSTTVSGPLDAPLRHQEWARKTDVGAIKEAASRLNAKRESLDGDPRNALLHQDAAVSSAETKLDIANITVEQSCDRFLQAYSGLEQIASDSNSDDARRLVDASEPLRQAVACWSIVAERQTQLTRISHSIEALARLTNGSSRTNAAIAELRERWAVLQVALRDRGAAYTQLVEVANETAKLIAKAAYTTRLSPVDRDVLSSAFHELPKTFVIEQQLRFIAFNAERLADESLIVTPLNTLCETLKLVEPPSLARAESAPESSAQLHEKWRERLDAVNYIIRQALDFPGAEW